MQNQPCTGSRMLLLRSTVAICPFPNCADTVGKIRWEFAINIDIMIAQLIWLPAKDTTPFCTAGDTCELQRPKHHKHITKLTVLEGAALSNRVLPFLHQRMKDWVHKLLPCILPPKKELFKFSHMVLVNAFLSGGNPIAIPVSTASWVETANTAKQLLFFWWE